MKTISIQGYFILKDKIQAIGPIKNDFITHSAKFTIYLQGHKITIGLLEEEYNINTHLEKLKVLRDELINVLNNDLCG